MAAASAFLGDLQRQQAVFQLRADPLSADANFRLLSKALQYLETHGGAPRPAAWQSRCCACAVAVGRGAAAAQHAHRQPRLSRSAPGQGAGALCQHGRRPRGPAGGAGAAGRIQTAG